MTKRIVTTGIFFLCIGVIATIAGSLVHAGVKLRPIEATRFYAFTDGIQSDGTGGYLGDSTVVESEWNVLTGPRNDPDAYAEDDPLGPPDDGWTLDGLSSFAIAHSNMVDDGGWVPADDMDTFGLSVINQASQDPDAMYGPEGWGYSVSYMLVTYHTCPTGQNSLGDSMLIELDLDFSGTLYASKINDEYFLDFGYALGTGGITDYHPVLDDPANNPNPGLDQFDQYLSWRSFGFSLEEPVFADSRVYSGVIGDEIQVLIALSSFSYSYWGYTWTDGTINATLTAIVEAPYWLNDPVEAGPQTLQIP